MNYLKNKLQNVEGIDVSKISDQTALKVSNFYQSKPFPNYKTDDDKISVSERGDKNFLAKQFKDFVGYNKKILEVGCGTGQLSVYFANGNNNLIVSLDATIESLKVAKKFSKKNFIENIKFLNADIFDDTLSDNFFDFIWCNGVLHHTKDPYKAFKIIIKSLKPSGYVLVGLYNKYGRIRTLMRKFFFKIFGEKVLRLFDPTLDKLKVSLDEKNAWIQDQYQHPQESLHTLDEVIGWFEKNNIEFISSIPDCDFENEPQKSIFTLSSKGNLATRLINQISMLFNSLGDDGGLFVVIGKKNES